MAVGVLLHIDRDQFLIQGSSIDTDPDRLAVVASNSANGGEIGVVTMTGSYVPGVDSVFIEGLSAAWVTLKDDVAVEVEVTDQRHRVARILQPMLDFDYRLRRLMGVDGNANKLGAGGRKLTTLPSGCLGVGGVGVGHGLHHHRGIATDCDAADLNGVCGLTMFGHLPDGTVFVNRELLPFHPQPGSAMMGR